MRKYKLAIIGAADGQRQICEKSRLMEDVETYGIAWNDGAVCKELVDHFIPISIVEKDKIVDFCKAEGIAGIITNASEYAMSVASYVAEKLKLIGTPYQTVLKIQDKEYVRNITSSIQSIGKIEYTLLRYKQLKNVDIFPCVIKPTQGSAKIGVNFIASKDDLVGIVIPDNLKDSSFLCEEYICGKEVSVESLSYKGVHHIIQITDKITSGPPHFVELGHLQPSSLPQGVISNIHRVIPTILDSVGFTNGATHIEFKIKDDGSIYLIEINPRGGGDMISNRLVELSTDCDYITEMINIALDRFDYKSVHNVCSSGIYFICSQNKYAFDIYNSQDKYPDIIESYYDGKELKESTSNYDRNGYILFRGAQHISL